VELMEQMPKVETAEFDPIGLFFLLVAVVPVVHWLWNYFLENGDNEEGAAPQRREKPPPTTFELRPAVRADR